MFTVDYGFVNESIGYCSEKTTHIVEVDEATDIPYDLGCMVSSVLEDENSQGEDHDHGDA